VPTEEPGKLCSLGLFWTRTLALMFTLMLATAVGPVGLAAQGATLIIKESPYSVSATIDRLRTEIESRGAKVAGIVDHAAAAKASGLELRPTTLIIFGSPMLGTPLMQREQAAGIDLPLRILVWQDAGGKVQVGYWPPSRLADAHGLDSLRDVVDKMASALNTITDATVGQ